MGSPTLAAASHTSTGRTVSARAHALTRRSYNRPLDMNDESKGFETFPMTINRVIEHQRWLWERAQGDSLSQPQQHELDELEEVFLARRCAPAGRTLWLGGTELVKRREASMFNCAGLELRTIHDFVDAFWLLLQGCGVGFKPISGSLSGFTRKMDVQFIRSTHKIGDPKEEAFNTETFDQANKIWTIRIGDSAEAWAKSLGKLVAGKFPAKKLIIDCRPIRAAGTRLAGYGWICNGDRPLVEAYTAICQILNSFAGKLLTKKAIWHIMNWIGTVLANRRSAQIGLIDYGDKEWYDIATMKPPGFDKDERWFLTQSNNSLLFYDRPSKRQLNDLLDMLIANGGAEPGIINAAGALKRAPYFKTFNPCSEILLGDKSFCVAGDTLLITKEGITRIDEAVDTCIDVWNGAQWSTVRPRITNTNQKLVRVQFNDGSYLDCTPYHRFSVCNRFDTDYKEVCAKDLMAIGMPYKIHTEPFAIKHTTGSKQRNAYTLGVLVGDGSVEHRKTHSSGYYVKLDLYGKKRALPVAGRRGSVYAPKGCNVSRERIGGFRALVAPEMILQLKNDDNGFKPLFSWSRTAILDFVAGLADTDGSETGTGGIRIYVSGQRRALLLQLLLTKCGVSSSVNLQGKAGMETNYGPRNKDMYYLQITDCAAIPCHRLNVSNGHKPIGKGKWQVVDSVTELAGTHTVYCFNEQKQHKAVFGNTLTFQCNLVEQDVAQYRGNQIDMHHDMHLLARANYRQTCVNLRDGILQDVWHQNNEYLRLCGCGLTGIIRRGDMTPYEYRQLRNTANHGAYGMADELGLQRPGNVTTVKPSGSLSKGIFDTTEGAHCPDAKHIINMMSFTKHDKTINRLLDAGYWIYAHPTDKEAVLAALPVSYPDVKFSSVNGHEINNESAVSQLERYKMLQKNWVDNNTSLTVAYMPEEKKAMVNWLDKNWDDDFVAVSFLFRQKIDFSTAVTDSNSFWDFQQKSAAERGFAYMPQVAISEATFRNYNEQLAPLDLDVAQSGSMDNELVQECQGGSCPIR